MPVCFKTRIPPTLAHGSNVKSMIEINLGTHLNYNQCFKINPIKNFYPILTQFDLKISSQKIFWSIREALTRVCVEGAYIS